MKKKRKKRGRIKSTLRERKEPKIVQERKRAALDKELKERELQEAKGQQAEQLLRHEISRSSSSKVSQGGLTVQETEEMKEMMKKLPPAPEKPQADQEEPPKRKDPKGSCPRDASWWV